MSYVNIWVHAVWTTKRREPVLNKKARFQVFKHIKEISVLKGYHVNFINGVENHVHCLISMNATGSISTLMNNIKGESSKWVNDNKILKGYFDWQDEYYAVSVSPHEVPKVRNYIRNQEKHHSNSTFEAEKRSLFGSDNQSPAKP
ncbi:MAG: IS200/IS605 family transposase [Chlorobi bacterium]|nr:IS200/IS605 family transposase [Chlorobiota bacterium]